MSQMPVQMLGLALPYKQLASTIVGHGQGCVSCASVGPQTSPYLRGFAW